MMYHGAKKEVTICNVTTYAASALNPGALGECIINCSDLQATIQHVESGAIISINRTTDCTCQVRMTPAQA